MSELDNAKITEEYDDYSEMDTDTLIKLEQKMSDEYYKARQTFSLSDYAEIIRELTLRENE